MDKKLNIDLHIVAACADWSEVTYSKSMLEKHIYNLVRMSTEWDDV